MWLQPSNGNHSFLKCERRGVQLSRMASELYNADPWLLPTGEVIMTGSRIAQNQESIFLAPFFYCWSVEMGTSVWSWGGTPVYFRRMVTQGIVVNLTLWRLWATSQRSKIAASHPQHLKGLREMESRYLAVMLPGRFNTLQDLEENNSFSYMNTLVPLNCLENVIYSVSFLKKPIGKTEQEP